MLTMPNGIPLKVILALVSSRSRGLNDDLAALALTLLLYDTASHKGLLAHADVRRSIPRATALARVLDWDTQRQCLDKGHSQAELYGFFCRLSSDKVKPGKRREWVARPFAEAWADYEWVSGQRSVLSSDGQPLVIGDGVKLRNVIDFRALLLRSLFDIHAQADRKAGERVWRITLKELCKMLGASEFATQTALNRAGLRKIGRSGSAPTVGYVMR